LTYNDGNNDHEIKYFYSGDSMLARIEKWDDTMTSGTMERRDEVRFLRAGFLTIQERDENNTIEREYTWGIDMAGGIGGLLNLKQNDQDYSYLYDGTGNVMNVVKDIDESIVASYRYDIFGKPLKKTGTFDQPYRFSTKRYDEATGLSYYGYRFYIPELGRWINRDPLGEAGEINLYGFVGNNPVSFVDPYGLLQITVGWSGGNILGGSGSVTWDSNTNQVTGSLGAGLGGGSGFTIAAGSSKPPADSEVSSGVMFTGTGGFRGFGGFFSWGGNNKGESVTDWGVGFGFGLEGIVNTETIILILLGILCVVGILFNMFLTDYLKKNHVGVWEALGSPSLFINNSIKNNWLFIKFLFKKEYLSVNDIVFQRMAKACALYYIFYLVFFVGVIIFAIGY
jgi:RHS repeat-associated protein